MFMTPRSTHIKLKLTWLLSWPCPFYDINYLKSRKRTLAHEWRTRYGFLLGVAETSIATDSWSAVLTATTQFVSWVFLAQQYDEWPNLMLACARTVNFNKDSDAGNNYITTMYCKYLKHSESCRGLSQDVSKLMQHEIFSRKLSGIIFSSIIKR